MNRFACILAAGALSLTFVSQVYAWPDVRYDSTTDSCRKIGFGKLEWESRPWGKGGQGFDNTCKSCHHRGNEKGAKFLYVESKSSKAWNRIFAQKKVACAKDGSWDALSQDQLLMVNDYLFRFGKGSQDAYHNY